MVSERSLIKEIELLAPAKINLYLAIQGQRPDGFHELLTLMTPLKLEDRLTLKLDFYPDKIGEKLEEILFSCDDTALPSPLPSPLLLPDSSSFASISSLTLTRFEGQNWRSARNHPGSGNPKEKNEENLVLQAAKLFLSQLPLRLERGKRVKGKQGTKTQLQIKLHKRIPHGAGLAGGSSDAAATLKGLNEFYQTPFSLKELQEMGAKIGSDVAFFITAETAWCHGRGEKISLLPSSQKEAWSKKLQGQIEGILLIKPPFSVATPWAYQAYAALAQPLRLSEEVLNATDTPNFPKLPDLAASQEPSIHNDLESAVFRKFPLLALLKKKLFEKPFITQSWMSGSGSTIVATLKKGTSDTEIARLQQELKQELGEALWFERTSFRY